MGLSMISAIKDFDEDRNESVNMRVGIHTGTVLCGIVGKRRFKFDVWSNDVTLANKMESTGRPGMVHISEKTAEFLKGEYFMEEGEAHNGKNKILFIRHRLVENVRGQRGDLVPGQQSVPVQIDPLESHAQLLDVALAVRLELVAEEL